MIVSQFLYSTMPTVDEGELTRIKSVAVSSSTLSRCAERMGLGSHIRVGKGVAMRPRLPRSILANAFEAITAAIYLDSDIEDARRFVLQHILPRIEEVLDDRHSRNYKSLLQQVAQRDFSSTPTYKVVGEDGPDHRKRFRVVAIVDGTTYEEADGKSKKEAEQQAARLALRLILRSKKRGRMG